MSSWYSSSAGIATVRLTFEEQIGEGTLKKSTKNETFPGCFVKNDANLQFIKNFVDNSEDMNKFQTEYLFYSPVDISKENVIKLAVITYPEFYRTKLGQKRMQEKTCKVEYPLGIRLRKQFFLCCNSKALNESKFLNKKSKKVMTDQKLDVKERFCGWGKGEDVHLRIMSFEMSRCQSNIYEIKDKGVYEKLLVTGPFLKDDETLVGCYRKCTDGNCRIKIDLFQKRQAASQTDGEANEETGRPTEGEGSEQVANAISPRRENGRTANTSQPAIEDAYDGISNDKRLQKRIAEAGYEVSFNPPQDGNCFYQAAAHQLDIGWEDAKRRVFDFLAQNPTDFDGNEQLPFLCNVDLGIDLVPSTWHEALEVLERNYANHQVILAFAQVFNQKIIIITVHGEDDYIKEINGDNFVGTLYFGHNGNHFVALTPKTESDVQLSLEELGKEKQQSEYDRQFAQEIQEVKHLDETLAGRNRQLEEQNKKLEMIKRLVKSQDEELQENKRQLNLQNKEIMENKRQLKQKMKVLQENKVEFKQQKGKLEEENRQLQEHKKKLKEAKRQLNERNKDLEEDKRHLRERNTKLEKENAQLTHQNNILEREKIQIIDQKKTQKEYYMRRLKKEKRQHQQKNDKLQEDGRRYLMISVVLFIIFIVIIILNFVYL